MRAWISATVLLIAVCGPARADETTLIMTTGAAPGTFQPKFVFHPWAERVNAKGAGQVKIDVRDGFALANQNNFYDRVMNDVVNIAWGSQGFVSGKFPLTEVVGMPFEADKSVDSSVALWRLYKTGLLDADYNEIVPLWLVGMTQTGLHMRKPIPLDSLNGLRMLAPGRVNSDVVTRLGAAPVAVPLTDFYPALQRGVADGAIAPWPAFPVFKLGEVTNFHIDTQLGGASGMVFMSKKGHAALPESVRKLFDESAGEAMSRAHGIEWDKVNNDTREQVRAGADQQIVSLTPAQNAAWRDKVTPLVTSWVEATPGGAALLAKFRTIIADVRSGR